MSRKRKQPTLKMKLAAALVLLGEIPYAHAKAMTADQVISLFQFDHGIYHTWGGSDDFWNLEPMFIRTHRAKTKKDAKVIAKVRRAERRRVDEANVSSERGQKTSKRKQVMLGSRSSGWKRKMNGKAERRPQP